MHTPSKAIIAICFGVLMSACGGGGGDTKADEDEARKARQEQLRIQALAKEREANSLVMTSPCQTDSQCKHLLLENEATMCDLGYKPDQLKVYSTASPTAAQLEAVAIQQNALVNQIREIEQNAKPYACPAVALAPAPPLSCVANVCTDSGSH